MESGPYWNAGYTEGIQVLERDSPRHVRLIVARPEEWAVRRYALNPYVHSLIFFHAGRPPRETQSGRGMGRYEVVRIPDAGPVGAADLPPGAWALLPAGRVVPTEAIRWILGPDGQPALAVVVGAGGA